MRREALGDFMKKSPKRLALHRETVHLLADASLGRVAGATDLTICFGYSCNSCGRLCTIRSPYSPNPDTLTFMGCV
ncbi:MAG TPA: hypothetical protein VGE98_15775 [Thermoanaerobaculia bacterium]